MASMPPAELEQQSVKQLRDFSFTLREGRTEDAQALGVICFDAFKAFNESVGTDYKMDFHSIEMSVGVIRACLEGPGKAQYCVVAVHKETGRPIGSSFLHHDSDVYSIGPISVDPGHSDLGVGRALMTDLIDRAKQERANSIRLTQSSLSKLKPASFVGLAINPDAVVRLMQEADVPACAQFFKDTNGYERLPALQRVLGSPEGPHAWVITSKEGEMLGYTTGFALFQHTCVRSESDFVTLYHGMTKKIPIICLMTLSTSHYPKLAQWALAAGLRLKRHNWYMVIGNFQGPKDNRVYFLNALH